MNSLIIPVYRNEANIPDLLGALAALASRLPDPLEVIFVDDGSPDNSHAILARALPEMPFTAQLLRHSRNFGSFAAIRTGLEAARGTYFAVMAADLQEPPELVEAFFQQLGTETVDVVVGTRDNRADPITTRLAAGSFWWLYRKLVNPDVPPGGVDVFACNRDFRDQLLAMKESNSSLIGLMYWIGFRRGSVAYSRQERIHGKSAWTLRRKLKYMLDSLFSFSDLPVRLLLAAGAGGMLVSVFLGITVLGLRLFSGTAVPGYTATMITILFFGGLNAFGLGLIGSYVWRAFANTQNRPLSIVMSRRDFSPPPPDGAPTR